MKKINLGQKDIIHFIGIGGIGMSGLAQIMKNMGFKVQGSDQAKNKNIISCIKNGIKTFIGHSTKNLRGATIIVKSTAIKNNNIEIKSAKKNKVIIKEAFMVRHHPQWQWVKKYIKDGNIGDISNISSVFSYSNKDPNNIRNILKYGGGAIYDIGCYPTVISRFLTDKEPKRVVATATKDKKFKTDILSSVMLDFGGIFSSYTVATQSNVSQQVIILGTKKTIVVENPFNAVASKPTNVVIYNGKSI